MTHNSIEAYIQAHEGVGALTRFVPRSRTRPKRRLYLTEEARNKFDDPSSAVNILVGRGKIEAAFTRWTLGERVYADGKKAKFLKRLESPPPEIWEIRVTEPHVQARIFGRFAAADAFVVTQIHTRQLLGKKGSKPWKDACSNCVAQWDKLFPIPPHSGTSIHYYVTENCDDFDI